MPGFRKRREGGDELAAAKAQGCAGCARSDVGIVEGHKTLMCAMKPVWIRVHSAHWCGEWLGEPQPEPVAAPNVTLNTDLPHSFTTLSGVRFDLANPQASAINIGDIAGALSLVNRYGGHTTEPLNVAEHSIRVALIAGYVAKQAGRSPADCAAVSLMGLLHDAAEAYVGDMISPLKALVGDPYRQVEERVQAAILERFRMTRFARDDIMRVVKWADVAAYCYESVMYRGANMTHLAATIEHVADRVAMATAVGYSDGSIPVVKRFREMFYRLSEE